MCVILLPLRTYVLLLLLFFVAVLVLRVCFAVFVTGLRAISDFIMILITYVLPLLLLFLLLLFLFCVKFFVLATGLRALMPLC